jgi:heat shock protein HslJ
VSSAPADAVAQLEFGAGHVSGTTDCNAFDGSLVTVGDSITISNWQITEADCSTGLRSLDEHMRAVLFDGEISFAIDGDVLRLRHPSGLGLDLRAT